MVGENAISFIRGSKSKPANVHIFKDAMDYLSIITRRKGLPFEADVIILNTWQTLNSVLGYLRNYGYQKLYTWMDNTELGNKVTNSWANFSKTEFGLDHVPQNSLYKGYKDVNEWHIAALRKYRRSIKRCN